MSQDIQSLLPELKRLAEAVGGGEWSADVGNVWHSDGDGVCRCFSNIGHMPFPVDEDDVAAYIAAANPAALLALVAHIEALERQLADLRQAPVERQTWPMITPEEMKAFNRFCDTCEDFDAGGYDVPKVMMKRLAQIGLVRSCGFGRYETTGFGDAVRDGAPAERQAPEWISVEDGLPEMWTEVMVHPAPTDYCMTASVDRNGLWHYGEYDREGQQTYETRGVTHWMPLPAAPSAGQAKREGDQFAPAGKDQP